MEPLENVNRFIPKFTDSMLYYNYFFNLLKIELNHEIQIKEKLHTNLKVSWENLEKKVLKIYLNANDFDKVVVTIGDMVTVYCDNELAERELGRKWFITGRVLSLPGPQDETLNIGFKKSFMERFSGLSISNLGDLDKIKKYKENYSFRVQLNLANYKRTGKVLRYFINQACNSANYIRPHIKNIILMGEINSKNSSNCLPASTDSYLDEVAVNLNPSQLEAVKTVLHDKFTLIQGPPGTGKTTTSAAIVKIFMKLREQLYPGRNDYKILVTSPSNSSADHLAGTINQLYGLNVLRFCSFIKESEMSAVSHLTLPIMVQEELNADPSVKTLLDARKNRKLNSSEKSIIEDTRKMFEDKILQNSPIICCTCTTAGDFKLINFKFPFVIVDESTQAIEPHCIIPICRGSEYVVLIGDHCQLGPTVLSDTAANNGLKLSLFERLLFSGIKMNTLAVQYRMHPVIAEFPSVQFYQNKIKSGVKAFERTPAADFWLDLQKPIVFHQCYYPETPSRFGHSYKNPIQCEIAMFYLRKLMLAGVGCDEIGIMTPYKEQKNYIRDTVKEHPCITHGDFLKLEINTIDSFQGREKEYIIFSTVRCNLYDKIGFLSHHRRLNVAITRAKRGLIIIGDRYTLESDALYNSYLNFLERIGLIRV